MLFSREGENCASALGDRGILWLLAKGWFVARLLHGERSTLLLAPCCSALGEISILLLGSYILLLSSRGGKHLVARLLHLVARLLGREASCCLALGGIWTEVSPMHEVQISVVLLY